MQTKQRRRLPLAALAPVALVGAVLHAQSLADDPRHRFALPGGDLFGLSLAAIGDLDRDGIPDFASGDPFATHGTATRAGAVKLYSGACGRELGRICGTETGEHVGASVAAGGDFDADGTPDVAIMNAKGVRVHSGRTGAVLFEWQGDAATGSPTVIAGLGDLDGDGHDELAVGAIQATVDNVAGVGSTLVFSGKTKRLLYRLDGARQDGLFGRAIASVGDLDGDGAPDFCVGSLAENTSALRRTGAVRAFSGRTGALLWTRHGTALRQYLGIAIARLGDIDGDRFADVLVTGLFKADIPATALLLSGKTGRVLRQVAVPSGMQISVVAICQAGDADLDGVSDYTIGYSKITTQDEGELRVYSGRSGAEIARIGGLDVEAGTAVFLGDTNADGHGDFAVSEFRAADSSGARLGTVHVLSCTPLSLTSDASRIDKCLGGTQTLRLDAGAAHARKFAVLLGSVSGIAPGIRVGSFTIPLNFDAYLVTTLSGAGFGSRFGAVLDANGRAQTTLTLPAYPLVDDLCLHHAFVVFGSGTIDFVSNPASLRFEH